MKNNAIQFGEIFRTRKYVDLFISFAVITAVCILIFFMLRAEDSLKYFIGVSVILAMLILYSIKRTWALYLVIFSIAFPIHYRIMDRDAFTLTTLLIIILFCIELFRGNISFKAHGIFILVMIVLFFAANTLSLFRLRGDELTINMRPYVAYLSAVMLFFLVVNVIKDMRIYNHILVLIFVFLLVQSLISLLLISGYDLSGLAIFATREFEFWTTTHRAAGLIHDYELLAEWYAVFIPFAFWLVFTKKHKWLYIIGMVLLVIGIVLTATRGAFLSLAAGIAFFLLFIPGKKFKQRATYFFSTVVIILASWFIIGIFARDFRERLIGRFGEAISTYQEGSSVTEVMNRQEIWDAYVSRHLSYALIGTGHRDPSLGHLHSLYFTLLFQTGLFGLVSFTGLLLAIMYKLVWGLRKIQDIRSKLLMVLCFSSLIIFIVDEIKIEYMRNAYCTQYAWLFLGLVFLTPFMSSNSAADKDTK